DGAGDRDRDGGKAQLEGDAVLKAIFSYVASDEAAHAGFYRKMVKIELGADREATVSDFAHVLANFKMPGDGLIPQYQERLRSGGGGITARLFMEGVVLPTLRSLGIAREEIKSARASRRLGEDRFAQSTLKADRQA